MAAERGAEHGPLVRQVALDGQVFHADLEEAQGRLLVAAVGGAGGQQRAAQRGAQQGVLRGHGVGRRQRARALVVVGRDDARQLLRRGERVAHDLLETEARGQLAGALAHGLDRARRRFRQRAPQRGGGQALVAVDADQLLHEVVGARHVGAPERRRHRAGVRAFLQREAERGEDAARLRAVDGHAQHLLDARIRERDAGGGRGVGENVGDARRRTPARDPFEQVQGARLGLGREFGTEALLEAQGRLAAQLQARGGAADGARVEIGHLEQDGGGRGRDLAVAAAHDAGQTHGPAAVADHERLRVEFALHAVERGQPFARARAAGAQFAAAHEVMVEGVQGLARLQHHVVGYVDDVVDGAHTRAQEALLHPRRRRPHLDALDDAGGEAGAEVGRLDCDGDELTDATPGVAVGAIWFAQGLAGDGGHLAREAEHAEQVGAVRPGRDVEHDVADGLDQGHARARVRGQHEDAVVVVAEAQLALAQHHARRLHAADGAQLQTGGPSRVAVDERGPSGGEGDLLAGGHVGRAADHRARPLARLHRGQAQAVGVGMRLDGEHLGHAHERRVPIRTNGLPALHLGDGGGHAARELRRFEVDLDVVAQPGEGQFHGCWLLAVGCWGAAPRRWMNRWSIRFTEARRSSRSVYASAGR